MMPLAYWLDNLKEARTEAGVPDIELIEDYLNNFKESHDEQEVNTIDARKKYSVIEGVLNEIKNPPNNL